MDINSRIKDLLKEKPLSLEELSDVTSFDSDILKEILDKMIFHNQIILSDNKYKIYNTNNLKEDIYNKIKEDKSSFDYNLKYYFNISYKLLNSLLNELIKDNLISYDKDNKVYGIPLEATVVTKSKKFGFVKVLDKEYYVKNINNVYKGDIVEIVLIPDTNDEASITKIKSRYFTRISGNITYYDSKRRIYYLTPSISDFDNQIIIHNDKNIKINTKEAVLCDLIYENDLIYGINPKNIINDKFSIFRSIALNYSFEESFSSNTYKELELIDEKIDESEYQKREDYRNKIIITIDGDDSKDFDDAISLEKIDDYYRLGVYIADVSHYVKEDTSLDNDAKSRGTSLYLPEMVIPMLPKKLSDNLCSLVEGSDRLVLACVMDINNKGNLINYEIKEGIINSCHRMTYSKVNKILSGDKDLIDEYKDIYEMLNNMLELSNLLGKIRHSKGSLDFDLDEYDFKLDNKGNPIKITKLVRGESEKIIENFMIKANETIAYHMNLMKLPNIYRVHEKPELDKLVNTLKLANTLGLKNDLFSKSKITAKDIQTLLDFEIENKDIINHMILRSMAKAKYLAKPLGHYGLQLLDYCHFTSPIRRYPDLITHRMIKKFIINENNNYEDDIIKYNNLLPEIAEISTLAERRSIDCEREVIDYLYAKYMEKNIGKKYKGIITSLTNFGMFINIGNGIEGLLSYKNMEGYFEYDEAKALAYSNDGRKYKLGDKVIVVVIDSNTVTKKIDFVLEEDYNYENYLSK